MYESAVPLATIYQPLIKLDRTFYLQEYFIPFPKFEHFMKKISPYVLRGYKHFTLLNITIRFVKKDETTVLNYAASDSYAFVMYFRLRRTKEADEEISTLHNALAEITLSLGGTFYLA